MRKNCDCAYPAHSMTILQISHKLKKELASLGIDNSSDIELLKGIGHKGIPVHVDLNQPIREVIICPNSRHFLNESVEYIAKSKVSHARIRKSKI